MNWRGRTVEYSGDPAKRLLVEVPCVDFGECAAAAARFVAGCGKGWERFCSFDGLGLAAKQPQLSTRSCCGEAIGWCRIMRAWNIVVSPRPSPDSFSSWSVATCRMGTGFMFRASFRRSKDPRRVDEKLIAKYGIGISRTSRARRKAVGIANVHYLRYQRRFPAPGDARFSSLLRRRGPEHSRRPAGSHQVRGVLDLGGSRAGFYESPAKARPGRARLESGGFGCKSNESFTRG